MNIDKSVDWNIDKSVDGKVGRVSNGGIDSDVAAKVIIGEG